MTPRLTSRADASASVPVRVVLVTMDTHLSSAVDRARAALRRELQKIPFFVRGKARRNTERFAAERGLAQITVETLYDAKAHFGR